MSTARLCVTVSAPTMEALRARRDDVPPSDLVELRLDLVDRPDVAGALQGRRGPVLVTCRAAWEGGGFTGSEAERLGLLEEALAQGAEYVDVEWKALTPQFAAGRGRDRLVASMHDFTGIPADLEQRAKAMRRSGAGTIKLAVMAHRLHEAVEAMAAIPFHDGPTVGLAMGDAGLPTRVLAGRYGSAWTYAADTRAVAPGQVSAERMRHEFRAGDITPSTLLYGVVGRPVAHSLSPAMHNAAFRTCGMDAVYLPLAAETFADFLAFATATNLQGASVTAPYKIDAFDLAGAIDAEGHEARAVNTLGRRDGRWQGRNTDAAGFMAPLAQRSLQGTRVTILGAGGAARSVAMALRQAGAIVTVVSRRPEPAVQIAQRAGVGYGPWPPAPGSWDLLVNATPVGTAPAVDDSPLRPAGLDGAIVYDLVYNPPRTRLLADAAARGCEVIGGLEMLVAQAAAQFTWWTGRAAPIDAMRQAALLRLRQEHERTTIEPPQRQESGPA